MLIRYLSVTKKFLLVLFFFEIVPGLSGCESFLKRQAWPPPYSLPAGSTLSINQDLAVKPNAVSVWIQSGVVVAMKEVDMNTPSCRFELYTLKPEAQTIYKDEATILRFVNSDEYVSKNRIMYASLASDTDDSGPMAQIFRTVIYLHSAKQPELYRLWCETWENIYNGDYLTVDQMQKVLGNIATFHSAE